ncbi:MAG TPA: hypothetical protein VFP59_00500 [Candidatus Angelobacter sp.]|nr:hypothetical protein [Candidatus Angelobacter sp.]
MPPFVTVILGCGFVAFGKWLYGNPKHFAPQWMPGANSQSVIDLARFLGISLVFVGIAGGGFALSEIVHGGFIGYIIVLINAPIITWLVFRKKRKEASV